MKSGKRHKADDFELPNHVVIKRLGEKETYKHLGILEADTMKQVGMREKKYVSQKSQKVTRDKYL